MKTIRTPTNAIRPPRAGAHQRIITARPTRRAVALAAPRTQPSARARQQAAAHRRHARRHALREQQREHRLHAAPRTDTADKNGAAIAPHPYAAVPSGKGYSSATAGPIVPLRATTAGGQYGRNSPNHASRGLGVNGNVLSGGNGSDSFLYGWRGGRDSTGDGHMSKDHYSKPRLISRQTPPSLTLTYVLTPRHVPRHALSIASPIRSALDMHVSCTTTSATTPLHPHAHSHRTHFPTTACPSQRPAAPFPLL
ncbi:hypothetical protein K438DRAFT_1973163 [Mycena galopus ATCC 62051]|nr:hypothetical protein K438DRAFT_1973163 [Mycena galopus ATCC 62051]